MKNTGEIHKMKLRFRILLMCLGSVLLALLIQTFLFQETSSEMIYSLSREESENSLENMQAEICKQVIIRMSTKSFTHL